MAEQRDIGQKISDTITIVFPMVIALLAALGLAGIEILEGQIMYISFLAMGIVSTIASIWFNKTIGVGWFCGNKDCLPKN